MFELLAPVFAVAGGLLAGVPLVLHLFRRTPALKMPFSIVRFLPPTLPTTTRRSTLEHWPLMLLRMLAVLLIALAFARPFQRVAVSRAEKGGGADRVIVLIDASASMRRDGLRDEVIRELKEISDTFEDQDLVSIAAFSENARSLITAAEWKQTEAANRPALIERAIESYEPDWLKTRTAAAMLEAADEVSREASAASPDGKRRVILITDFQEGSELDDLRSGTWPDSVELEVRLVQPAVPGNAGLSLLEDERSGRLRVRVTNSGDAAVSKFLLQPFDASGAPVGSSVPVEVGGGLRRAVSMPEPADGEAPVYGVQLIGEPHVFDNTVDVPIEERSVRRIAHAGSTNTNDPENMRYYLQRVLDGNETEPVEIVDLIGADNVAVPPPDDVRLVFVTDAIPEGLQQSLEALVNRGGTLVIALSSPEMAESLQSFLPEGTTISEGAVKDYAMLGQIDFSSSLMSPFADARFADFSSIRFWKQRTLTFDEKQSSARVIARFDTGSPAILEIPRPAAGKIFVFAAGWQPTDSQWALSTRFPPMIQRLVRIANPTKSGHQLFEAGDRIDPAELLGTVSWSLTLPDGSLRSPQSIAAATATTGAESSERGPGERGPGGPDEGVAAQSSKSSENVADTGLEKDASSESLPTAGRVILDVPGRWILTGEGPEGPKSLNLLVSVPASESRTEPLPIGQLQALGMAADVVSTKTASDVADVDPAKLAQMDAMELESQQKYWRWFLLAGLMCLLLESIASFMLERRQQFAVATD